MSTILFVEDQFELRAIHTAYLQSHGFNVITASDGEAGLALARETHPDVMVLDHSLPRRTGVEIANIMQDDPELARIPIVMLTARSLRKRVRPPSVASHSVPARS